MNVSLQMGLQMGLTNAHHVSALGLDEHEFTNK